MTALTQIQQWQMTRFMNEEMDVIKNVWRVLVEDQKIVFGKHPPAKKNMDRLIRELKGVADDWKEKLSLPLPSTSTKYRALLQWVTRKSKKELNQTLESSVESNKSYVPAPGDE